MDGYLSVDELHKVLTSIGKEKFTEEQVMFIMSQWKDKTSVYLFPFKIIL